ncbi:MAG: tail fiber protein [Bacteroidia bacterium]|nr:tail fiber protein [Bacteroidia bacterium]
MSFLSTKITFNQAIAWGAANSLGESFIRKLFNSKKEVSIIEILEADVHPHFKTWLLLRPQLLTSTMLHEISQHFAEEFISKMKKEKVYMDFQLDEMVNTKKKWINGEISLGALEFCRLKAGAVLDRISELKDSKASAVAFLVKCLLNSNAFDCMKHVYMQTIDASTIIKESVSGKYKTEWTDRLNYVSKIFKVLDKDKLFNAEFARKQPQEAKFKTKALTTNLKLVPVGTILPYAGEISGSWEDNGWMICDGRLLDRTSFAQLFAAINTNFGTADSTTFNIPDLRGLFIRGTSGSSDKDPDRLTRFALNVNGNTGNKVGSYQNYATAKPKNDFKSIIANGISGTCNFDVGCQGSGAKKSGDQTFAVSSGGELESCPVNSYVYYIIKYAELRSDKKEVDIPLGAIMPFAGITTNEVELNWILCDGKMVSNLGEFKNLFDAIGFSHGGNNPQEFRLPDYRGLFLRGISEPGGKDPGRDKRKFAYPAGAAGYQGNDKGKVGSMQESETAMPFNPFSTTIKVPTDTEAKIIEGTIRSIYKYNSDSVLVEVTKSEGDLETRPVNVSVNWYIRFR